MTPAEQLQNKVETLKQALLAANPGMPTLLRDIHNTLREDPDLVTILSDEEISVVVNGLMRQTNTEISANVMKKGTGKTLKKTTVEDLGL